MATTTLTLSRTVPAVVPLIAGTAVAIAANAVVAAASIAAGAAADYAPLTLPVYGAFTVVGIAAGYLGWRQVRRRAHFPARVLRVLVPLVLVASFVPDVVVGMTQAIPGTTTTGIVGLAIMHVVVAAVGVPVYQRVAPVRSTTRDSGLHGGDAGN